MNQTLLLDALEAWEEARGRGEDPSPAELCPDTPGVHELLAERIARRRRLLAMLETRGQAADRGEAWDAPGFVTHGLLGRGGAGSVFAATHAGLNRPVAVKVLAAAGPDRQALDRFRSEGQALAALRHPNIVEIFEVGEHDGRPFMVLERLDGSLADRLRDGPLSPAEAAGVLEPLARAVQHAHDAGVLHRDLKPGNVLIDESPAGESRPLRGKPCVVKVADFGLAKQWQQTIDAAAARTAGPVGTPAYMAPEQFRPDRDEVTPRADIWALGVILYEMLTGRPPFQAAEFFQVMALVGNQEPVPPRRLQPGVPRDLETVCLKCLRKHPDDRYAAAGDLADDLRRFLDGEPVTARPVPAVVRAAKWAKRRPAVAGFATLSGLALTALIAVGAVYNRRLAESRDRAEAALTIARSAADDLRDIALEQFRLGDDQRKLPPRTLSLIDRAAAALDKLGEAYPDDADLAEDLGYLLFLRNRADETQETFDRAVAALRRAYTLRDRLVRESPDGAAALAKLADTTAKLARMLAARGFKDEPARLFGRLIEVRQSLAVDPDSRLALANARIAAARFWYYLKKDSAAALRIGQPGLDAWAAALASDDPPQEGAVKYYDGMAVRAMALHRLGRYRASAAAWDVVMRDVTLRGRLKATYSLGRALTLAHAGDHVGATAAVKAVRPSLAAHPELLPAAARVYAVAAKLADAARYREAAASLLRDARDRDVAGWEQLRDDADFAGVAFPTVE